MSRINVTNVGAPDPELETSPIIDEFDERVDTVKLQQPGEPVCLFNGKSFKHNEQVCSGDVLLYCDYGAWIKKGSCDPDNP